MIHILERDGTLLERDNFDKHMIHDVSHYFDNLIDLKADLLKFWEDHGGDLISGGNGNKHILFYGTKKSGRDKGKDCIIIATYCGVGSYKTLEEGSCWVSF